MDALGHFDVTLSPKEGLIPKSDENNFGRMLVEKTYHGDLVGTSVGEMLSVRTKSESAAGYVAIEHFTGTLDGFKGSFVLQHYGIMDFGDDTLVLEVVPASGTGQLKSITGVMKINPEKGKHHYQFSYIIEESVEKN